MRSTLNLVNPIGTTYKSPKWHSFLNASNITVAQACNATAVTPLCLRTLYGTYDYIPKVPGINKVGLTDYLGESNNRSDIYPFLQMFRPEAASEAYTFTFDIIANGSARQTPDNATQLDAGTDLEGNLDAETLIAIDYPTPLIAFTTGGSPPFEPSASTTTDTNEPYLPWLNYVLAQPDLPQTISTSYSDDEQTVPYAYATPACQQSAQLGARGITLLFASRDSGVGPTGACLSNDGKTTTLFLPSFPASCPYVTTVGAAKNFAPGVAAFDPANSFASRGGFSNYFPAPRTRICMCRTTLPASGVGFKGCIMRRGAGIRILRRRGFGS
ncbi:MAG: tripeptidyl peptidase [Lasallia pustulata]|uniref:Tripeptidyl peptidase n=1 Tax=Lasallia pustulata TaxID=136370 RepID=A0A5M8PEE5_9LECA|nr:MAG: tripeptidyl peptidase [Lasallia pustulata]